MSVRDLSDKELQQILTDGETVLRQRRRERVDRASIRARMDEARAELERRAADPIETLESFVKRGQAAQRAADELTKVPIPGKGRRA